MTDDERLDELEREAAAEAAQLAAAQDQAIADAARHPPVRGGDGTAASRADYERRLAARLRAEAMQTPDGFDRFGDAIVGCEQLADALDAIPDDGDPDGE